MVKFQYWIYIRGRSRPALEKLYLDSNDNADGLKITDDTQMSTGIDRLILNSSPIQAAARRDR